MEKTEFEQQINALVPRPDPETTADLFEFGQELGEQGDCFNARAILTKTRDVYVAYRKAGYSKAYRAEHESEILLHQAAKKYFDSLGMKKLPTVKSLQAEYAALLAEKKSAYTDYRKARDEMRELLTVKANVDRILGQEEQEKDATRQEEQR